MIPYSPGLNFLSFFRKKKEFWKKKKSTHQFFLSKSSWSLLAICVFKKKTLKQKKVNLFLPEYFCNEPLPLLNIDIINIIYYQVDKDFHPDLKYLNIISEKVKPDIFLCVHYFGQPTYSNELKNFSIKHKSWYVEDATHCLKKDSIIGNQGDFILFSPYKHLPLPDGAILLINKKGPSKLDIKLYENIKINNFLKKELIGLNHNKNLLRNSSNISSLIWFSKQIVRFFFQKTEILNNYYKKKYKTGLKLNYDFQTYSYKISVLSKWLIHRFDLDYISKVKLRNQFIFKNILKNSINIHPKFDLALNYQFHTPYIFPVILNENQNALNLIENGFPIIKWPLLPESNIESRKSVNEKFDKYYFLVIHNSIKSQHFKKLIKVESKPKKIELRQNKVDIENWNKIASKAINFNILQSWNYGISKSEIEKKKIDHYEILINQKSVGFFQILSKTYFKVIELKRINRGPILIKNISLQEREKIIQSILNLGNIFNRQILSFSPEISFFSIESIIFKSKRLFKLPIPNWKSSNISLENDLDSILVGLKPKWRNALKLSQKQNIIVKTLFTNDSIDEVLKKYNELTTKKNFKGISPDLIREISLKKNMSEQLYTLEASIGLKTMALIVVSIQSKNSIYLIGWTNEIGRKFNANNLLLWEAIRFTKNKGCTSFDLGGLIGNSHPIDLFKLGLNGNYYENLGEYIKI